MHVDEMIGYHYYYDMPEKAKEWEKRREEIYMSEPSSYDSEEELEKSKDTPIY